MDDPNSRSVLEFALDEMYESLCCQNLDLFAKLRLDVENGQVIPDAEKEEAKTVFESVYPNWGFEDFWADWTAYVQRMVQDTPEVQDTQGGDERLPSDAPSEFEERSTIRDQGLYVPRPVVLPARREDLKRKKVTEFNTYRFILSKQKNQDYFPLHLEMDYDMYLRDVDVDTQCYKRLVADEPLRKVGTVGLMLNKSCNHRVIEVVMQKSVR